MIRTLASLFVVSCLLLTSGVVQRGTTAQDRTLQPGQPTQGKVWIQNRGETEAVPVSIQNMPKETLPVRVQVIGTPTVTIATPRSQARAVQQWEYRDVAIPAGQVPTPLLNAAGADGWEAIGLAIPVRDGTVVVMKRPR